MEAGVSDRYRAGVGGMHGKFQPYLPIPHLLHP